MRNRIGTKQQGYHRWCESVGAGEHEVGVKTGHGGADGTTLTGQWS